MIERPGIRERLEGITVKDNVKKITESLQCATVSLNSLPDIFKLIRACCVANFADPELDLTVCTMYIVQLTM